MCNTTETTNHILTECIDAQKQRASLVDTLEKKKTRCTLLHDYTKEQYQQEFP
jgi:hypothetical protein